MLTYVREGTFAGLTNDLLRDLGAAIELCPGMPGFLNETRSLVTTDKRFASHNISVEHYVISSGLRKMIEGSAIGPEVDGIWACDFIEVPLERGYLDRDQTTSQGAVISQIGYAIDNTTKTRAVFEINKGVNVGHTRDVNEVVPPDERRVPFKNMVYIADGPSDVPVFSILNQYGGRTFGVYTLGDSSNYDTVKSLQDLGRVQGMGEANYTKGSPTWRWLTTTLREIATEIATTRERYFRERPGAPGHTT